MKKLSTPQMVTVPANGTYNISASGVKKIFLVSQNSDLQLTVFWENGTHTYALQNNSLLTNPATSQLNQYITYANNTITIHSSSGVNRNVWITYM